MVHHVVPPKMARQTDTEDSSALEFLEKKMTLVKVP